MLVHGLLCLTPPRSSSSCAICAQHIHSFGRRAEHTENTQSLIVWLPKNTSCPTEPLLPDIKPLLLLKQEPHESHLPNSLYPHRDASSPFPLALLPCWVCTCCLLGSGFPHHQCWAPSSCGASGAGSSASPGRWHSRGVGALREGPGHCGAAPHSWDTRGTSLCGCG